MSIFPWDKKDKEEIEPIGSIEDAEIKTAPPKYPWWDPYGMFTNIAKGTLSQSYKPGKSKFEDILMTPGIDIALTMPSQIKAYHGSWYKFPKFSSEKIGTGEGAQAFGYGHYLTESPEVARKYARDLQRIKKAEATTEQHYTGKGKPEEIGEHIYETTIHKGKKSSEYTYLEWDKPLANKHRKNIQKMVDDYYYNLPADAHTMDDQYKFNALKYYLAKDNKSATGQELYNTLAKFFGSRETASKMLNEAGFSGIKYPTGTLSGIKGSKEYNYVVFNPEDITIENILPPGIVK